MLLGIIGDKRVANSLSPAMHQAALAAAGLKGCYERLEVERQNLASTLAGLWRAGYQGLNITMPFKRAIMPYLENVSGQAAAVGAINTLTRGERGFIGHNTDINGCLQTIKPIAGQHEVVVAGTGGAARAMLAALQRAGHRNVCLTGRNEAEVMGLAACFKAKPLAPPRPGLAPHWFINATSVSRKQESRTLWAWAQTLRPRVGVIDLNYGRDHNFWRALAARHEAAFQDGLVMLAWQAKHAFKLWSGKNIAIDVFWKAL